ncbi:hypothetical protein EX30DRAFT_394352 [Ascodesmis nigricans]|uniref:FAD-binding FR-type domain-containing protein n=1 Tax=Ascodesmis nigricans TaxID=341454 RepID=A0A4S2N291_9PEZI|nr:hypothetical protein EX30DRAFT_394352 [Ascodesmis nigricans]
MRAPHLRLLLRRTYTTTPPPPSPKPRRHLLPITLTLLTAGAGTYYYTTITTPQKPTHLNPDFFTRYTLTSHTPVSSHPAQTAILTLTTTTPTPAPLPADKLLSIELKQPSLQIARHYTPLPGSADDATTLRLFIKKEPGGEMSRYLLSLHEGADVFVRGPHEEWDLEVRKKRVLFLAGGTGIAPALQAAEKVCARDPEAEVRVLWGVRARPETEGEMEGEVERLGERFGERVRVEVRVDRDGGIGRGEVEALVRAWATAVGLSGPDGFLEFWAGRKEWAGGVETQGKLGGVLAEVLRRREEEAVRRQKKSKVVEELKEIEVWKL